MPPRSLPTVLLPLSSDIPVSTTFDCNIAGIFPSISSILPISVFSNLSPLHPHSHHHLLEGAHVPKRPKNCGRFVA